MTEQSYEKIAEVCHEANRALCRAFGDDSQKPWAEAPENIKASAVDGVRLYHQKPDTTPEDSHRNWCEFKVADGWTYGPEKDMDAKTHPCLVPYDGLPPEQRAKDYVFGAIAKQLLSEAW
jgi:hypothetical protein